MIFRHSPTTFSREAQLFASEENIRLWDGDKVSKLVLSVCIGRFGSHSRNKDEKRNILLDMALLTRAELL